MKPFKFFQKEESHVRNRMFSGIIERLRTENERFQDGLTDNPGDYWGDQRQIYDPLQLTASTTSAINDAIRHEEYLHSLQVRGESVVDWGQMARDIREQARLREMINRPPIEILEEFQHRGRRPRNTF